MLMETGDHEELNPLIYRKPNPKSDPGSGDLGSIPGPKSHVTVCAEGGELTENL